MKLALPRCSVVIVGAWNVQIFTPEWTRGLFPAARGFEALLGPGGLMVRAVVGRVSVTVLGAQVLAQPLEHDAFEECERVAVQVLAALPETPVPAFGINVGFDIDSPSEMLARVLTPPEGDALTQAGAAVRLVNARRQLTIGEDSVTVNVERELATEQVRLDFNHHFDVRTPAAKVAAPMLQGMVGPALRRSAELARAYGVS